MGRCAEKTLIELANPGQGRSTQLDLGDFGRIKAYSLDSVGNAYHTLWKVERASCKNKECPARETCVRYRHKGFKTADALCICRQEETPKYYFIEFKAQPSQNVTADEIWGKAFESLGAAVLSELGQVPMDKIRSRAEFIVVYRTDKESSSAHHDASNQIFGEIAISVKRCAGEIDEYGIPIFFGLNKFVKRRVYRAVHTFDEAQFRDWAGKHLPAPDDNPTK